jgi:hypothetical protein
MSTIGTIVDIIHEIPDAWGAISRLVKRIRDARPEDRAAIIAVMEQGAEHTHRATVDAYARLDAARAARADEPTVTRRISDTGEAG